MARRFISTFCFSRYGLPLAVFAIALHFTATAQIVVPSFPTGKFYSSGGTASLSVAKGDFNLDGKPDFVFANQCGGTACALGSGMGEGSVEVLFGRGNGSFYVQPPYDSGGCATWDAVAADVNGDGWPDIVAVSRSSGSNCTGPSVVGVLLNAGAIFQPAIVVPLIGNSSYTVAVADVNGDHKPDLLVGTGNKVSVLLGNGDGTFQAPVIYAGFPLGVVVSIATGDLNGDGKVDLVISSRQPNQNIGVLLGNGDGSFQPAIIYDSGGYAAVSIALADLNKDGRLDLVAGNYCQSGSCTGNSVVSVMLGNGHGGFQPATLLDAGVPFVTSVTLADTNGDGNTDILVCPGGVALLLGKGDGSFQAAVNLGMLGYATAVADVNRDGRADIVLALSSPAVFVSLHANLSTHTSVSTSGSPSFVGQPITFMATAAGIGEPIPDGELITFSDGKTTLASVAASGGKAAYTTSALSAKMHIIKAAYAGDTNYRASSSTVSQTVNKYSTTTKLSSSTNPSLADKPVTFTAQVAGQGPNMPTGKVRFLDGTTGLGTVTLTGGVATLTKSTLAAGTHSITAEYLGDNASSESESVALSQVVQ